MANFNKVILVGNLTRDPELRYAASGTAITKMGLAVNRYWKDKDGNRNEEVSFVNVTAFGQKAETLAKYLAKGQNLLVDGRLQSWKSEAEDGTKRRGMDVILEGFQFMPRKISLDGEEGALPI